MRCPDCNKFVAYDTDVEPEQNSIEINNGELTASVRRVLTCADCGGELKDYDFDLECTVEKAGKDGDGEHEWDIDCEAESTTETQTKDRNGKPIRNSRYMRTLYGVSISGSAKCEHCDLAVEFSASENAAASNFNELV